MTNNEELYDAILNGRLETAVAVTRQMLAAGADPHGLIDHSMIRAMEEIGARFEAGKAFVPNLLMSARAMKGALELLRPMLKGGNASSSGKVVIGTVKGDLHDIGKNLVASMLEGCGFEVVNLGVDVSSERFIEEVVAAVRTSGLDVKIMVGGAPVTEHFAQCIGADGYSSNANAAVTLARRLVLG